MKQQTKNNLTADYGLRENLIQLYIKALIFCKRNPKGTTEYKQTKLLKERLELNLGIDESVYELMLGF